jgi:ribosomal protein L12E/L44/L45/RPP1/RPP2
MDMNVALKITAGVSGQQAVDQLRTSMDRMKDTVDGVSSRFGALKGAMAGLAGAAVVAGFVNMMKSIIDTADHLNDLRQKTGMAVEDLSALGYVAQLNGSSLDQVAGALGKLAKSMAEAAGGSKDAIAVFRQFGISQGELKDGSISATDALARIADKIAAMPDGWQKTAAAQKVFGKSAADMVPLLNAGGDAIRQARGELESMGALSVSYTHLTLPTIHTEV